jgi:hypothetical protein
MIEIAQKVAAEFTTEFVQHPYLCYTEHGQHAYFYQLLFNAIPEENRFTQFQGRRLCVVQKEYPTPTDLGKSQRQHWDVSIIKSPAETISPNSTPYDFLRLDVIVEFGMNAEPGHLAEDIRRMTHETANVDNRIAIHFYRIGEAADRLSRRDIARKSSSLLTYDQCTELIGNAPVELFYAVADPSGSSEAWHYRNGASTSLLDA